MFATKKGIVLELKFTKEHEWIKIENEPAIIGISEFAQEQLGDIVSIELPKAGAIFRRGQPIAIVDSVKASSDIYAPISGEIVEVNEGLIEKPELINQSPYESGWRSEEHTSELQSRQYLVCRLLLEKKKNVE